jgi:hypothetical protein
VEKRRQRTHFEKGVRVYYREGIEGCSHRIEQPLSAGTVYLWTIRTRNGSEVGPWSTYDATEGVHLLNYADARFKNLLFPFVTPLPSRVEKTPSAGSTLPLKAALVLSPEFCATSIDRGHQSFSVGDAVCAELEPALGRVFAGVTRVTTTSLAQDAQVVLLPKHLDILFTMGLFSAKLTVLLEWAAKDASGRTVWSGSVQGSATRRLRSTFTLRKDLNLCLNQSAKDAAEQSAAGLSSAPELRKLIP